MLCRLHVLVVADCRNMAALTYKVATIRMLLKSVLLKSFYSARNARPLTGVYKPFTG
jgi:hypothetical protein